MDCGGVTLLLHRLPENLPRAMIYPQPKAASRAACRRIPKRWRVIRPTQACLSAAEFLKTLQIQSFRPLCSGDNLDARFRSVQELKGHAVIQPRKLTPAPKIQWPAVESWRQRPRRRVKAVSRRVYLVRAPGRCLNSQSRRLHYGAFRALSTNL
jgi:hypothetical protein